jgi:hypothetical protein
MENKFVTAIINTVLVLAGLFLSFFVVLNFMFTDMGGIFERAVSFAITAVAYGIVGVIAGIIRPRKWRMAAVLLTFPALLITLWYSFREEGTLWVNLIYFTVAAAFVFLGAYLSSRIRLGKKVE